VLFGWKRHGVGRFSKEGEAALALAREEAIRFNNDYVGPSICCSACYANLIPAPRASCSRQE
jgi:hypothetical protein